MTARWLPLLGDGVPFFDLLLDRLRQLDDTVRRGAPAVDARAWLDRRPGGWRDFQAGMLALARMTLDEVVARLRLPAGARRLIDVGGGHGLYAVALYRRHPGLTATDFDLAPASPATLEGRFRSVSATGRQILRRWRRPRYRRTVARVLQRFPAGHDEEARKRRWVHYRGQPATHRPPRDRARIGPSTGLRGPGSPRVARPRAETKEERRCAAMPGSCWSRSCCSSGSPPGSGSGTTTPPNRCRRPRARPRRCPRRRPAAGVPPGRDARAPGQGALLLLPQLDRRMLPRRLPAKLRPLQSHRPRCLRLAPAGCVRRRGRPPRAGQAPLSDPRPARPASCPSGGWSCSWRHPL